jgi:MoaD family protein
MKINITVRFFDQMREIIGKEVRFSLGSRRTVGDFLNLLYKKYGKQLRKAKIRKTLIYETYIIQVNNRHIRLLQGLKTELSDGDVLDIIPIIGGG